MDVGSSSTSFEPTQSFSATATNRSTGDFQTVNSLREAQQIGFEYMSKHDWPAEAKTAAEHAVMKLTAPSVTPGKYDLVLHPSHLFLTIHESIGHPTELDRALLWEANYAGTSFLTPEKTGKLQFGSKMVNIVADRTQPQGMATVGYDDEGVPGQSWHLIKDGLFVDWQTTRDTARLIGKTNRMDVFTPTAGTAFLRADAERFAVALEGRCLDARSDLRRR
jgi:TldD protein